MTLTGPAPAGPAPSNLEENAEALLADRDFAAAAAAARRLLDDAAADPAAAATASVILARALDGLDRHDEAAGVLLRAAEDLASTAVTAELGRLRARLALALAHNARARGEYDDAVAIADATLAWAQACFPAGDPLLWSLRSAVALAQRYAGRLDAARPLYRAALAAAVARGDHETAATAEHNLSGLELAAGHLAAAETHGRRALEARLALHGDDHPLVVADRAALAGVLAAAGRLDDAEPLLRQAIGYWEARHGPDHVEVGINLTTLASVLHRRGHLPDAISCYHRGIAIREKAQGRDHPELVVPLVNLARALAGRGDPQSRAVAARAVAIGETGLVAEHPALRSAHDLARGRSAAPGTTNRRRRSGRAHTNGRS